MSEEKHYYVSGVRIIKDDEIKLARKLGLGQDDGASLQAAIEAREQELEGKPPHHKVLDDILPTLLKWQKAGGITLSSSNPNTDHNGKPIGELVISHTNNIKEGAFYIDKETNQTVRARLKWSGTVNPERAEAERKLIKERFTPVTSLHKLVSQQGKYSHRKRDEDGAMKVDEQNPYSALAIRAYQLKEQDLQAIGGVDTPVVIAGHFNQKAKATVTTLKAGQILYIPADNPDGVWVAEPQDIINHFTSSPGCKELYDACTQKAHLTGQGKLIEAMPEHAIIDRWIRNMQEVGSTRDRVCAAIAKNLNERAGSEDSQITPDVVDAILERTVIGGQQLTVALKGEPTQVTSNPIQPDIFEVDKEGYDQHRQDIGDEATQGQKTGISNK